MTRVGKVVIGVGVAGLALVTARLALRTSNRTGPVEVAWDREPCAHCRMHVGDPSFAVQLQSGNGRAKNFDDVGCYFRYLATHANHQQKSRTTFFHHYREKRWIKESEVSFVEVPHSPMGSNLAAVEAPAGTLSLTSARKRVLASSNAAEHAGQPRSSE